MAAPKILAIFAHPDDETFICGGTLAKYAKAGADITLVCATKGEMGRRMGNPPFLTRESMPIVRERELREACRHLGIRELIFLQIRDKTVEFADAAKLVQKLACLMDEMSPEIVLTFHEKWGGHPDHCAIGRFATAAYQQSRRTGSLYFISFGDSMKNPERFGLTQDQIMQIDVSESLPEKLLAFRAHRCQTEIERWVWESDDQALAKFGKHEYFIIGDKQKRTNPHDLFVRGSVD